MVVARCPSRPGGRRHALLPSDYRALSISRVTSERCSPTASFARTATAAGYSWTVPTAFTHAIVGAGVAICFPREVAAKRLMIAAAVLAVLPDVDVISFSLGIPYDHPLGHRGLSHSLPFAAAASFLTATLLFPAVRVGWRRWWLACGTLFTAAASHGLLDACTNAGLGIGFLIPFDNGRYFLPWRPLATSPVDVGAFFEGPALSILANEVVWVWTPLTFVIVLICTWRYLRSR